MKREYSIETNEGKIYPLGVTKTQGGFDVAFVSEKKPALLLFEKGSRKRMARLAFPESALYDGKRRFYRSGICL